jgi:hypothetical protein
MSVACVQKVFNTCSYFVGHPMLVFRNKSPILWDGLQEMIRCRPERWNMKSSRQFKREEEPRNYILHMFLTTLREFLLAASHSVHEVGTGRQTTN